LTEEIKNLVGKKHDYFQKLIQNRRGLENLRVYLEKTKDSFDNQKLWLREKDRLRNKDIAAAIISITDDLHVIDSELVGEDEEVIDKINRDILFINESMGIRKPIVKKKKKSASPEPKSTKQRKLKEFSVEDSIAKEKEKKANGLLPKIQPKVYINKEKKGDSIKKDVGMFNNYEYLAHRENSPIPHFMLKKYKPLTVKKETKKVSYKEIEIKSKSLNKSDKFKSEESMISENEERQLLQAELEYDYETTTEKNFELLMKRQKKLEKINKRIMYNLEENENIYSKKIDEMEMTIDHNENRLKNLHKVLILS
jgi:hypothetical protein